ncbi:MAG TPA: hypothetical protein ENN58_00235, partial [bacterium]|nr:hypothetical protein [bacterium]
MDVKYFLTAVFIILLTGSSCTSGKFTKFKNVSENEFEIEEMPLEENYNVMEEGELEYRIGVGDEIKITIYGNPQDST